MKTSMIYELWIGDRIAACTYNQDWLLSEAVPFHSRFAFGRPVLITSRAE